MYLLFLYLGWSDLFLNLDSLNHLIDLKFLHIPSTKVCTSGISSERNSRSITQEQILSLLPNLPNLKIISFLSDSFIDIIYYIKKFCNIFAQKSSVTPG